jgi:uncharacterized membrane protein (DUF106 family)
VIVPLLEGLKDLKEIDPIAAIVVIAGTATLVSASAGRHLALSDRMRTLATEWRNLQKERWCRQAGASGKKVAVIKLESERQDCVAKQVKIFSERCKLTVWAHISLYIALAIESMAFGCYFALAAISQKNIAYEISAVLILAAIVVGIFFHVLEHIQAWKTIKLEVEDVTSSLTLSDNKVQGNARRGKRSAEDRHQIRT